MTSTTTLLNDILTEPEPDGVGVRILDAALAEYLAHGFRRTSVDDIARRAGLGRATVYRRFATRDELVQAVLMRECRRLFTEIAVATDELATTADRLVEGFVVGMRAAREQPLLRRMLTTEPESWLPLLTTQGGPVVGVTRVFLARQYGTSQEVAEILVRLGLSLALTPDGVLRVSTDDEARDTARRYLVPLVNS
jgi:AcrR family transcriptional regulator